MRRIKSDGDLPRCREDTHVPSSSRTKELIEEFERSLCESTEAAALFLFRHRNFDFCEIILRGGCSPFDDDGLTDAMDAVVLALLHAREAVGPHWWKSSLLTWIAIRCDSDGFSKWLTLPGADPSVDDDLALSVAVHHDRSGDASFVRLLLSTPRIGRHANSWVLMRDACKGNKPAVVAALLRDRRFSGLGNSILHDACKRGAGIEIVTAILSDPNVDPAFDDHLCAYECCERGHLDCLETLLCDRRTDPARVALDLAERYGVVAKLKESERSPSHSVWVRFFEKYVKHLCNMPIGALLGLFFRSVKGGSAFRRSPDRIFFRCRVTTCRALTFFGRSATFRTVFGHPLLQPLDGILFRSQIEQLDRTELLALVGSATGSDDTPLLTSLANCARE